MHPKLGKLRNLVSLRGRFPYKEIAHGSGEKTKLHLRNPFSPSVDSIYDFIFLLCFILVQRSAVRHERNEVQWRSIIGSSSTV